MDDLSPTSTYCCEISTPKNSSGDSTDIHRDEGRNLAREQKRREEMRGDGEWSAIKMNKAK